MRVINFLAIAFFSINVAMAQTAVDVAASHLQWTGTKVTGKHTGKLRFQSGTVELKDGNAVGGEFVVDINSLTVEDLSGEWAEKFLGHMKSADFFDVAKYPTAKLVVTKVIDGKLKGKLTIKDKSHPIDISFKKEGNNHIGSFKFNRTKYAMVYNSGSFFKNLGDKMVHDEVNVDFVVVLK